MSELGPGLRWQSREKPVEGEGRRHTAQSWLKEVTFLSFPVGTVQGSVVEGDLGTLQPRWLNKRETRASRVTCPSLLCPLKVCFQRDLLRNHCSCSSHTRKASAPCTEHRAFPRLLRARWHCIHSVSSGVCLSPPRWKARDGRAPCRGG